MEYWKWEQILHHYWHTEVYILVHSTEQRLPNVNCNTLLLFINVFLVFVYFHSLSLTAAHFLFSLFIVSYQKHNARQSGRESGNYRRGV
jgi:hypothetical protein